MKIKRMLALFLCAVMGLTAASGALAADIAAGEERVIIGADLTVAQREQIYQDFGLQAGAAKEMTVTNQEERAYLEGLVPDGKIGRVALSCLYIKTLEPGSGIELSINNINWCTENIYRSALQTAGITDAQIKISAPFAVSGTAALTAAYKAYEDSTGESLDMSAKDASTYEMVVAGNLSELLGDVDATSLINELKGILEITKDMSDDDLKKEIVSIANRMGVALTDGQIGELVKLVRKFEKMDSDELKKQFDSFKAAVDGLQKTTDTISKIGDKVKTFFQNVAGFFKKLFS